MTENPCLPGPTPPEGAVSERHRADNSGACMLRLNYYAGSECGKDAAYRVYAIGACFTCERSGYDACNGHVVCVDHACALRTTAWEQRLTEKLPPFVVGRIHSLGGIAQRDMADRQMAPAAQTPPAGAS